MEAQSMDRRVDRAMSSGKNWLLLLSSSNHSWSYGFDGAYGQSIESSLIYLNEAQSEAQLDIALCVPTKWPSLAETSRTSLFDEAQEQLALAYGLVGTTAANLQLDLDWMGIGRVRVFLLAPPVTETSDLSQIDQETAFFSGPLFTLAALAASPMEYQTVCVVQGDRGNLYQDFVETYGKSHKSLPDQRLVAPGKLLGDDWDHTPSIPHLGSHQIHTSIAVGGTFDHLHIGHKLLLSATALLAEPKGAPRNPSSNVHLTIGISGDELLKNKKYADEMESWETRQRNVSRFLESIMVLLPSQKTERVVADISLPGQKGRCVRATLSSRLTVDYVEIADAFGPTITDPDITALVLSQETRAGGAAVNDKRLAQGWPPLEVFEVGVLGSRLSDDEEDADPIPSFQSKISSTDIRQRIHKRKRLYEKVV